MEYIFGIVTRNGVPVENLKTVGDAHSDFEGFVQTVRNYADSIITDRFRVVEKYRSDEDVEGNCYDWYIISDHYRYEDKFTPGIEAYNTSLTQMNEVSSIMFVTLAESGTIDDVTAGEHMDVFEEWRPNIDYKVGNIRRYTDGNLYRCVQAHRSLETWMPPATPALWVKVADPSVEWPDWSQPLGAHDAYPDGAKVTHNSKHWISNTPNNVWEPGVYGWDEAV